MAKKKKVEGNCAICGKYETLTFEHIPPKKAFNNSPIQVQLHEQLFDYESHKYQTFSRKNNGFGRYTLCQKCNNLTGDWYARDYIEFASQGMENYKATDKGDIGVKGEYTFKPLNVLKQVIAIFLSADHNGSLQADKELIEFILNKEKVGLSKKYKVFIYSSVSKKKRLNGIQTIRTSKGAFVNWSEFNFNPFGFVLAVDSVPPNDYMVDISKFGDCRYNDLLTLNITMPYFVISSPFNGVYDNIDESLTN